MPQRARRYLNVFFMNSNNCSGQNVSINVNLSLKNETLRILVEMSNDMGASLEDVISSITEDSVIDLERLQDDLGIVIIPERCSKQDLINSIQ
ncbi:possible helix-turn-helix protein, CopG family [Prochlorococcus marinus str. NATL2A]|uniref:Possible helix-turn-helix protein, CopG family n=2 Tax=Prochlorococcus marinus TaxID=1219 RepID=Q46JP2_PROMT|nr:possible helix-turn-helix protein, CopG family [Prochlorococcus marinus str. NATL2A]